VLADPLIVIEDDEEVNDEPEPDEDVTLDLDEKATAPDSYMNFVIITPGDMIRWENRCACNVASHVDSLEKENDDGNGLRCISCELTFSLVAQCAQHACDGPPALQGLLNEASKHAVHLWNTGQLSIYSSQEIESPQHLVPIDASAVDAVYSNLSKFSHGWAAKKSTASAMELSILQSMKKN